MKYRLYENSKNDTSNVLKEVLKNRGIDNYYEYLNLKSDVVIPYSRLDNIDKAVNLFMKHFENRNKKVLTKCGQCKAFYYEKCKAGCERFEEYCAFPKITYSNWYRGDYNA